MPQPTAGDVHVNAPLTNISIAYIQGAENFIADRVFPNVPVQKKSDVYYAFDRGEFNRDEMTERAPATESAGGGYTVDNTASYLCRRYSFHKDVDDETRANSDSVLGSDRNATQYVSMKAMIKKEKIFATNYFAGSIWTNDYDGVNSGPTGDQVLQWDDASSTPIEDIRFAKTTILQSTGFEPNTLVIGQEVFDKLIDHPDIVDRVKYGAQSQVSTVDLPELQALFKIQRILVMKAIQNTANKGATNSHAFIGGKKALLLYAAPQPGIEVPSAGYTFSWAGLVGAGNMGTRIKKFRMDNKSADRIEIDMAFDQKVVSADLGFFWDTVVA